ncbi:GNAT family N-acetyltransferase [Photobacterium sagamiensis]|uniref:GNAT family N-acetyltransferase n=1 Tax=Photobacterium sagamiensis TaxID=2910241 RepID=UPI003D0AFB1F
MTQQYSFQTCSFETDRLKVSNVLSVLNQSVSEAELSDIALTILTPNVTQSLPPEFQSVQCVESASKWINEMVTNSHFLIIQCSESHQIIGFIFLYEFAQKKSGSNVHIGYLLGERFWGNGYANEFMVGLIEWCNRSQLVSKLLGGVDVGNAQSIKLLENNGFKEATDDSPNGVISYERSFGDN